MHTLALYIYQRPTNTYSIFLLIKKTRASTRSAVFTVDANYFFQKSKQSFLIDNISAKKRKWKIDWIFIEIFRLIKNAIVVVCFKNNEAILLIINLFS